jgi:hypothetical protein
MQATVNGKRAIANRTKLALATAALVAGTVVVVSASTFTSDSTHAPASRVSAPVTAKLPAWRFAEMNELPVTTTGPAQQAKTRRMLEINQLPGASTAAPSGLDRQHFIEMNQLPGDAGQLVAPEIIRGSRS